MRSPPQASARRPVALTGIKPTGTPHLGNYFSAIAPAISFTKCYESFYFIANYHALNAVKDPKRLHRESLEVAATWLACGLDPKSTIFYQQSDIPEIFEITTILMAYTAKGYMNRAHAYKAAINHNRQFNRDPDDGINMGLFNYPLMMAADILAFKADLVPIGKDQIQHLEMAQDIAEAFNRGVGTDCLQTPKALIHEDIQTIIGTDGRKMSKSYGNVIPLFGEEKAIRKAVMKIVTSSQSVAEPKDPETCHIYSIYRLFAAVKDPKHDPLAQRYRAGGMGWGEAKEALLAIMAEKLQEPRERYHQLIADETYLWKVLREGAEKARERAAATLTQMKKLIGIHTSSGPTRPY